MAKYLVAEQDRMKCV